MPATLLCRCFVPNPSMCARNRPLSPSHCWRVQSVPLRVQPDCDKPLLSKQNLHSKVQVCGVSYFVFSYCRNRLRMRAAIPKRPVPIKPKVEGSGTAAGGSAGGSAAGTAAGTTNRESELNRNNGVAGGGGAMVV